MKGKRLFLWAVLAAGVGLLAYPLVSQFINLRLAARTVLQFQTAMGETDFDFQRRRAEQYNESLLKAPPAEDYADILNISDGIMGYLKIEKIRVELPISHGTDDKALGSGVGHLPESAFPIGGEGNHAVLTGHTGLPGAKLLTDLNKLEKGDRFTVSILGQELVYQVDRIQTVLPQEAEALAPIPGEDLCTLVTCTPYGINSHRLLVRGKRVEE